VVLSRDRFGRSITAHLARLGIIDEHFSGAHGVWLDDDEIGVLADCGATIAHNPGSNLRLGSGIADAGAMVERGIAVGIGTDGGASSDGQNMFEMTRLACNLSRIHGRSPERWFSAREAIAMATEGSARVLGFHDRIGRIAPGFKADLVFLDLGHVNFVPLNDLTNQIVHVEDGSAVAKVMVGGVVVVERGRLLTIDLEKVADRAAEASARLRAANAQTKVVADMLAPHVGRFCHGLLCSRSAERRDRRHLLENA
jgi:guanine deaminase